jgi:UDP-N-acetylmuramate dehydrogenase
MQKIRKILKHCLENNPCNAEFRFNEPMSGHTSFQVGGPADCWVKPLGDASFDFAAALIDAAKEENIPLFILGKGANILVSDKGIRGIVLDSTGWTGEKMGAAAIAANSAEDSIGTDSAVMIFRSGTSADEAAKAAAARGLGGLEFLAGMPGSMGGALWMNARAYEKEMADTVICAEIIDFSALKAIRRIIQTNKSEFSYKSSPFQNLHCLILSVYCSLHPRDKKEICSEMETYRMDREAKGHYRFPSAGSVFKNNRSFGKPTGQIIDELGLKGFSIGGAQIAPFHGNIIINTGSAAAHDIRSLIELTAEKIKKSTGYIPEPEIIFIGDW